MSPRRPILEAYHSAIAFAARPEFASRCVVTREEYQEMGSSACRRKFRDWKPTPVDREPTQLQQPAAGGRGAGGSRARGKGRGPASSSSDSAPEDDSGTSPTPAQPTKKPGRGRGRGRGARGGASKRGA